MFNKNTWYSIKQWKTYGQHFNGNGATGGSSTAKKVSTGFKIGGYGLSAFNAYSVNQQYNKGEIGTSNMIMNNLQIFTQQLVVFMGDLGSCGWGKWKIYHQKKLVSKMERKHLVSMEI